MLGEKEQLEDFKAKLPWLFYSLFLILFILVLRLAYLQIYEGETYRFFSQENTLKKEKIPGPRGRIYDRNHKLLVDNRLQLNVTINPQFAKDVKQALKDLAKITGLEYETIYQNYTKQRGRLAKFSPIPVITEATWEMIVKIENFKSKLPGIDVEATMRRVYLYGGVGSHVLGYLSEVKASELKRFEKKGVQYENGDWIGRSGLEREWESYLRGHDGYRYVVVDAHGHRISNDDSSSQAIKTYLGKATTPKPGKSVVLTIDADLQETAAKALEGNMGAVVALDPRTGEVLAMHSAPGFDPTVITSHRSDLWTSFMKNPYGPLRNKAVQDHFPPGSTYKIVTALAGLNEGLINENTLVNCTGQFWFGKRPYHCHKKGGHGWVNLRSAIRQSCDIYFYTLATKLGINLLSEEGFRLGFGKKTGIRLFGEVPGLLPTEEWKEKNLGTIWLPGETLSASIGQGYNLVTPLQTALAYATFANGGDLYQPYLASKILDEDGTPVERFTPQLKGHQSLPPKAFDLVSKGLNDVVNAPGGTAYFHVRSKKVNISGKSGTVQVMSIGKDDIYKKCNLLPFDKRHHGWFVGFAPAEKPEIVVAVFAMHACGGSTVAGPIVKAVIEKWWDLKQESLPASVAILHTPVESTNN